ncbi:peptidoglycan-binding domain-containing protein [Ahrensia sp. R2A130]|uniref:peptidoglycan-binding domain-containing protein n=1 Tax=Ahrensia sp. R2A130 TaxID=744979 RepID=UPI0001E0B4FC|nr:peptidoglycan-binding domain-containing protein [Ahrensia sp. R2A130]EFL88266.1 N-acetylmuramoyl-L-alanine amidase [Ahrensia sp. R2A130]
MTNRKLNEIVVHCAATPEGREVSVATIRKWHKARGWSDIGYHFVIGLDGKVHKGRPLSKTGAHVRGRNRGTVGICYVGGVSRDGRTPKDTRTHSQKAALLNLINSLMAEYPSIKLISGHHDYAAKACPSFPAREQYADLSGAVAKTSTPPNVDERYRYLQRLLTAAGYPHGLADGIKGPRTIKAIKDYQEFMGLPKSGEFDKATVVNLRVIEETVSPRRPAVTAVAFKTAAFDRISTEKAASGTGGTLTTLASIKEGADSVGGIVATFASHVPDWFVPVALTGAALCFGYTWYRRDKRQREAQEALA